MLQRALIRYLLEPVASFTERIPVVVKENIFRICFLGVFLLFFAYRAQIINWRYLETYALCCILIAISVFVTLKPGMQPIKIRKSMAIAWFGTGVFVFVSGILQTEDYLPEAVLFLVGLPVVFLAWQQCGFERIIKLLVDSVLLSFLVYLIISVLFVPMTGSRYQSFFFNVNVTAMYLSLVFAAAVSRVLQYAQTNWKRCAAYCVVLGVVFASTFYTGSRTGQLSVLVTLILSLLLYFCLYFKKNMIACTRCVFMLVLAIVLLFNTTLYMFQLGNILQKYKDLIDWPSISTTAPSTETPTDPPTTPPTTTEPSTEPSTGPSVTQPTIPPEEPPVVTPPPAKEPVKISDVISTFLSRILPNGKTLDAMASGRISVWKEYIKQWSWFGHKEPLGVYVYIHSITLDAVLDSPHNGLLQIYYQHGIFAAICYFVYLILSFIASIRFVKQNKDKPLAFAPFIFMVACCMYALFSSAFPSFYVLTTLFYHLMQFCLWEKPAKKKSLPS